MKTMRKYFQLILFAGAGIGIFSGTYELGQRKADFIESKALTQKTKSCLSRNAESQALLRAGKLNSLKLNPGRFLKVEKCFEDLQSHNMNGFLRKDLSQYSSVLKQYHTDLIRFQSQASGMLKLALQKSLTNLNNSRVFLKTSLEQNENRYSSQSNILTNTNVIAGFASFTLFFLVTLFSWRRKPETVKMKFDAKNIKSKLENLEHEAEVKDDIGLYQKNGQFLSMDEAVAEFESEEDESDEILPSLPIGIEVHKEISKNASEAFFTEALESILPKEVELEVKSSVRDSSLKLINMKSLEAFTKYLTNEIQLIGNNFSPYHSYVFHVNERRGKIYFNLSSYFSPTETGLKASSQKETKYSSYQVILAGNVYRYRSQVLKNKRGIIHGIEYLFNFDAKEIRREQEIN